MQLSGIEKRYGDVQAVRPLELPLPSGSILGLLGANGAGKSTLIKIIMGLTLPDNGTIQHNQQDYISLLPEQPYLPASMSAYQLLRFACRVRNAEPSQVGALLQQVDLDQKAWKRPIHTYSKGMRQRTALAYALAGNPRWLILDEPMSGLDALGRRHVLDLLREWHTPERCILMSSHVVSDLVRLCDRVHIMAAGTLCETIAIEQHSMQEAEQLEARLEHWNNP